ncbi:hypothetical protein DICVIV_14020 [Dictyocaulus viviparus]|uniref:Uncharacterized protein n=1 Tax=Dictyocaulus viviparus TaxID=29172 RepID=A0A0D8X695_DICVI|nr:hypothetical protein DICVIV_14020 [Dictyocaulus viviparus]
MNSVDSRPENEKSLSMSSKSSKSQDSRSQSKSKSKKIKQEINVSKNLSSGKSDVSGKKKNLPNVLTKSLDSKLIREPVTSAEFESYLNSLACFAIEYYDNPTAYNVTPDVKPGFLYNKMPKNCPQNPEPFKTILDDLKNQIVSGVRIKLLCYSQRNFAIFILLLH